jgi:hypothetical protein
MSEALSFCRAAEEGMFVVMLRTRIIIKNFIRERQRHP